VSGWTRRVFSSVGLTQCPPGPHWDALQRNTHGRGYVVLCIDVSGSMEGNPLVQAVQGARTFIREGIEANYEIGLVLWNTSVIAHAPMSARDTAAMVALDQARAGGGNDLMSALNYCDDVLRGLRGDRVVAIFGDGDISPELQVLNKVSVMKADNIRFITRGLGRHAAEKFALLSSEGSENVEVHSVRDLAAGIASMSEDLKKRSGGLAL
jgi:Mg-chelatase subunit ChlD